MPSPELLYAVKIDETDKNSVVFRGHISNRSTANGNGLHVRHNTCGNMSSDSD